MRSEERPFDGWCYRRDGQALGPVPTEQVKDLLAVGRVQPRQAVWRRHLQCLLFVQAARAASGAANGCAQPSGSEPAPA